MNRFDDFQRYVYHYAQCLKVTPEWQVWVSEAKLNGDRSAEVTTLPETRQAWIKLSKTPNPEQPVIKSNHIIFPADLKQLAAHEVVHLLVDDYYMVVKSMFASLPKAARLSVSGPLTCAEERLVNALADIVVGAFPIKEES